MSLNTRHPNAITSPTVNLSYPPVVMTSFCFCCIRVQLE